MPKNGKAAKKNFFQIYIVHLIVCMRVCVCGTNALSLVGLMICDVAYVFNPTHRTAITTTAKLQGNLIWFCMQHSPLLCLYIMVIMNRRIRRFSVFLILHFSLVANKQKLNAPASRFCSVSSSSDSLFRMKMK